MDILNKYLVALDGLKKHEGGKTMLGKAQALIRFISLATWGAFAATPQVKNVKAFQQYPWNGRICITYEIEGHIDTSVVDKIGGIFLFVTAKDKVSGQVYGVVSSDKNGEKYLSGDTGTAEGKHKVVWDIAAQGITINSTDVSFLIKYSPPLYVVVDLSSGSRYSVTYMNEPPSGGFNVDTYKTTKFALRLMEPGSFMMSGQCLVTLTKPFYCGVFEVTQRQYTLVTGTNPSHFNGNTSPVECVSYDMIRGTSNGALWPLSSAVDDSSFMGKLRMRTGINFDLPTEAQWEYACRAGTTSMYNNGGDTLDDLKLLMDVENSSTTTPVGSYMPNAWGFYDMHGNVEEWCLDWYGVLPDTAIDPVGIPSSNSRIVRGGWFNLRRDYCTSSYRDAQRPTSTYSSLGFRLAWTPSD